MTAKRILVAGAAGALGRRIALRLVAQGQAVTAAYRTERPETLAILQKAGCSLLQLDLAEIDAAAEAIAAVDAAVLAPILTASGPAARAALARGAGRLVLFSSNNVAIDWESPVYAALRAEEAALESRPGAWTLVRPTMIYGHPADGNLSRLIRTAQRLPALPLPGGGRALQQPIHVDDLARLAVHLLDAPAGEPRVVAAAGPRPVSLRALYGTAARASGKAVAPLPLGPLKLAAGVAGALGLPFPLDAKQLARIALDKTPQGPAPVGWRAEIGFEEGVARLAAELGLAPRA